MHEKKLLELISNQRKNIRTNTFKYTHKSQIQTLNNRFNIQKCTFCLYLLIPCKDLSLSLFFFLFLFLNIEYSIIINFYYLLLLLSS